jgi:hypothetical protein
MSEAACIDISHAEGRDDVAAACLLARDATELLPLAMRLPADAGLRDSDGK